MPPPPAIAYANDSGSGASPRIAPGRGRCQCRGRAMRHASRAHRTPVAGRGLRSTRQSVAKSATGRGIARKGIDRTRIGCNVTHAEYSGNNADGPAPAVLRGGAIFMGVQPMATTMRPTDSIFTLNLPNRASSVLWRNNVREVGELVNLSDVEFLRMRGVGATTLEEVHRILAEHGLSMRSEPLPPPDPAAAAEAEWIGRQLDALLEDDRSQPAKSFLNPRRFRASSGAGMPGKCTAGRSTASRLPSGPASVRRGRPGMSRPCPVPWSSIWRG